MMSYKKILIPVMMALIISGCKMSGSDFGSGYLGLSVGEVSVENKRELTKSELEIATRICAATMLKRALFSSYKSMQVSLEFSGSQMLCGSAFVNELAPASVFIFKDSNLINPEFLSTSSDIYFSDILFDNGEVLSPICEAINLNLPVMNFHENDNYKFAINFKQVGQRDTIEWIKVVKNNGAEVTSESNSAWINTNLNHSEKRSIGLELSRKRILQCGENKTRMLKKDFIKFK